MICVVNSLRERGRRLDALVCNAGVKILSPLAQLTLADSRRVIDTNLTSTFLLVRAAEELLRAARC